MNPELENKLYKDFPLLFDNRHKSPMETPMCFGIECDLGWYDLIRTVCFEIKSHEDHINRQTQRKLEKDPTYKSDYVAVRFEQVKSKWGTLRMYITGGDEYVKGVIHCAESMSGNICEVCGNKGKPNNSGWITTLCEGCRKS